MEWTEERIKAYRGYVKNDELSIRDWKRSLNFHKEGVERAESMIESITVRMNETIKELEERGVNLYD